MSNVPFSPPTSLPSGAPINYSSSHAPSMALSSGLHQGPHQQDWGYWDNGSTRPTGILGQSPHPPAPMLPYHSTGPNQGQYQQQQQQQQQQPYYQGQSQYPQSSSQPLYPPYPTEPCDPAASGYMSPGPPQAWSTTPLPPSSVVFSHTGDYQASAYQAQPTYDPTVPRSVPPIDFSIQSVSSYYGSSSSYGNNNWQQSTQPNGPPTIPSQYPDPLTLVPQFRRRSISAPSALDSVLVGVPGARTSPTRGQIEGAQTHRQLQQQPPPPAYAPQSQVVAQATTSDASDSPPFSLLSPGAQLAPGGLSHGSTSHTPLGYGPAEGIVLKTGMQERPPYPLSTLIAYAIATSRARRLTLQEIYAWLLAHYPYYVNATTNWRNTVRHTLSTSNAFVKQEKSLSDFGKGAFWTLDPNKADKVLKKARRSSDPYRSNSNAPAKDRRYRATSSRPDLDSSGTANGSIVSALPTDHSHRSFVVSGTASAPTRATPLRQMIRRPSGPISEKEPAVELATVAVPLEPPAQPQYPNSSLALSGNAVTTSSAADFLHHSWSGGLSRTSTGTGTTLSTSTSLDSLGSLPAQPGDPVVAAEISQLFSAAVLSSSEPVLPSLAGENAQTNPSQMVAREASVLPNSMGTIISDASQNPTPWIPPSTASLDGGLLGLMQQVEQNQQRPELATSNADHNVQYPSSSSSYNTGAYPSQASTPQMPQMSLANTPSPPTTRTSPT